MKYITYADSDKYPVALLIKNSAFNAREIENAYIRPLGSAGVLAEDLISITADYDTNGKASVAFIKSYLNDELLPALQGLSTEWIYCADANYFKVLTRQQKAESHLGYILPCAIPGYEHMNVVLGINHRSMLYNDSNVAKLSMSLDTLVAAVGNNYQTLGADIIKSAYYPETPEAIEEALQELHQYPDLSCDIEGYSLRFEQAGIATITFCWNQHEGIAFKCDMREFAEPQNGRYFEYEANESVRALLKKFFTNFRGTLRWHNSPYDVKSVIFNLWMVDLLDNEGLLTGLDVMTTVFHDTKVIAYLATNTTAGNSLRLKDLAHEFAGNWAQEDIKDIRKIPPQELLQYNLVDGLATNYVFDKYYPIMVQDQQEALYYSLMMPSQRDIIQVELTGMPMCPHAILDAKNKLQGIMDTHQDILDNSQLIHRFNKRLQQEAMEAANAKLKVKQHPLEMFKDVVFNPNSGPQKQKLLFEEMSLPIIDLTETKLPATGGDTLEKLVNHTKNPEHLAIIEALIGHSQVAKILSSFIPAFEKALDKGDGVVWLHGSLNLGGTKSGRLSSSDPNLQNLPSGSVYGKLIKGCFTAPDDWLFAGADYNSLEDYISALQTKDPNKLKVYLGHTVYELEIDGTVHHIRDDAIIDYDGKQYTGEEFYDTYRAL